MSEYTYLCPCCNTPSRKLKRISEIGFSLRDPFYDDILNKVAVSPKDTSQINAQQWSDVIKFLRNDNRFKHLSHQDIKALFPGKPVGVTAYAGEMVVTWKWFREKAQKAWDKREISDKNKAVNIPEDLFQDNDVLHRDTYELQYHDVNGCLVPRSMERLADGDTDTTQYSSKLRRCSCGRELSRATGTAEELIVVMQGSSRAGKSTTMVAMEYLLNQDQLADAESPIYFESNLHDIQSYEKALEWLKEQHDRYGKGLNVEKTKKESKFEELLFSFRLHVNGHVYVLTLVDMAGEIFDGQEADLSQEWIQNYLYIYRNCHAIWTSVPYQTLASIELDWDLLVHHRNAYQENEKKSTAELEQWQQECMPNGDFPSFDAFMQEIPQDPQKEPYHSQKLLEKYRPVHEARMLAELGETKAALARAELSRYRARMSEIQNNLGGWQPPHAVLLTKTDCLGTLFHLDQNMLDQLYIYPSDPTHSDAVLTASMGQQDRRSIQRGAIPISHKHLSRRNLKYQQDQDDVALHQLSNGGAALSEEFINRACRNVREFFNIVDPLQLDMFTNLCPGRTSFFALSAYGGPAGNENSPTKRNLTPYHVTLPLLWTLALTGPLPVSYVKTTISRRNEKRQARDGNGWTVHEETVASHLGHDNNGDAGISEKNLFANAPYQYHETHTNR